jgi:ABC-type lipoprotein release transport system permease subunit
LESVKGITGRTSFLGSVSDYENDLPVIGSAVFPETDGEVFTLGKYLEGEWFSGYASAPGEDASSSEGAQDEETQAQGTQAEASQEQGTQGNGFRDYEIIIGSELADEFSLSPGDYILLKANMAGGAPNAAEFLIRGVVETPNPGINRNHVYIPFETAEDFLGVDQLITEAFISLDTPTGLPIDRTRELADRVQGEVKELFPHLRVLTFEDGAKQFLAMMEQEQAFGMIMYVVVLLIAAVGIVNTILMSVYERIREVGVLRALGFQGKEVVRMFLLEGLLTGIIGSLMGIMLGLLLNIQLVKGGMDFSFFVEQMNMGGLPVGGKIYGVWNLQVIPISLVFGVVVSLLAGYIPARKAGRIEVTRALRFE